MWKMLEKALIVSDFQISLQNEKKNALRNRIMDDGSKI